MKSFSALTVRKKFGRILDEVVKKKEPVVILRANQPLVVMFPYEEYKLKFDQQARTERLREVTRQMDEWAKRNAEKLKGLDPALLVREMRNSR